MFSSNMDCFAFRIWTAAIIVAAVILLFAFIWEVLTILPLVFTGLLVGLYLHHGSLAIAYYTRLPYGLALGILFLFIILLVISAVTFLVPPVYQQTTNLLEKLPQAWQAAQNYLLEYTWGEEFISTLQSEAFVWTNEIDKSEIMDQLAGIFSTTLGIMFSFMVIMLIGVYVAAEPRMYVNGFLMLFAPGYRPRLRQVMQRLSQVMLWWLFGQGLSMLTLGLLMTLGLWLLGIPYALALGLFTAIMTFIPNIGPLIAAVPTLLIALAQSPLDALYVLILTVAIQNIEGLFITPTVHRHIISMPPALIISVQILLGSLIGFLGILLTMPLIACVMVIVRMVYVEDMLGDTLNEEVKITDDTQ